MSLRCIHITTYCSRCCSIFFKLSCFVVGVGGTRGCEDQEAGVGGGRHATLFGLGFYFVNLFF